MSVSDPIHRFSATKGVGVGSGGGSGPTLSTMPTSCRSNALDSAFRHLNLGPTTDSVEPGPALPMTLVPFTAPQPQPAQADPSSSIKSYSTLVEERLRSTASPSQTSSSWGFFGSRPLHSPPNTSTFPVSSTMASSPSSFAGAAVASSSPPSSSLSSSSPASLMMRNPAMKTSMGTMVLGSGSSASLYAQTPSSSSSYSSPSSSQSSPSPAIPTPMSAPQPIPSFSTPPTTTSSFSLSSSSSPSQSASISASAFSSRSFGFNFGPHTHTHSPTHTHTQPQPIPQSITHSIPHNQSPSSSHPFAGAAPIQFSADLRLPTFGGPNGFTPYDSIASPPSNAPSTQHPPTTIIAVDDRHPPPLPRTTAIPAYPAAMAVAADCPYGFDGLMSTTMAMDPWSEADEVDGLMDSGEMTVLFDRFHLDRKDESPFPSYFG